MTVNTTNITGFIVLPDDTVREKSSVIFTMTGFDTDADDNATVVPIPREAPIAADGSIDIDLWPNPEGVRTTFYRVTFSIYNGNKPYLVDGGLIEVPVSGGPYDLNDLLPVAPPQGATVEEYIAQLAASVAAAEVAADRAEAAADLSREWAENPEDVEVDPTLYPGEYSARHWAGKSEASAVEAALYDGPKVDTFPEIASVNAAMVDVGGLLRCVEVGAVYERAADAATDSDLDYSGSGGVKWYVMKDAHGYDPRAFGAAGNGTTDDTFPLWAAAQKGNVDLTQGYYKTTSTIELPKDTRVFHGKGHSDLLFSPTSAPDNAFRLDRTNGVDGLVVFDNVMAVTDVVDAGSLVEVEETRVAAGPHVVGSYDIARLVNGTMVSNSGTGYWRNAVRAVNAGGVIVDQATIANFGNITAQADTDTAAIAIINDDADFNVIRALHWDQSYTQRFQHAVYVYTVNSIESLYLGQGEMIGHFYGVLVEGGGKLGAVHIIGTHMDSITSNVRSQGGTTVNVFRAEGHDLRLGENGASLDNSGINIRLENGNYHSIIGGFMDSASGATNQKGIVVVNNIPGFVVQGNNFRNQSVGVQGTSLTRATVGVNEFENVTTEYDLPETAGINIDMSASVDAQRYGGDLDDLAGGRSALSCVTTTTGATSLPPGVNTVGNFVETHVFDANAAYQKLSPINGKSGDWWRKKGGGVWGAWAQQVTGTSTGWAAATGTGSRAEFATSTVTTEELAKRVKSLIDDLITRGVIGS